MTENRCAVCGLRIRRAEERDRPWLHDDPAYDPFKPPIHAPRPEAEEHDPPVPVLILHPEDVDLPWVKAEAACKGVDVVGSVRVPRGSAFLVAGEVRNAT